MQNQSAPARYLDLMRISEFRTFAPDGNEKWSAYEISLAASVRDMSSTAHVTIEW